MRAGGGLAGERGRWPWVALVLAQLALVRAWTFVCDDAWITFRYGRNLVRGDGLSFNPGDAVEGYSNLAWVLAAAVVEAGPGDPSVVLPLVSAACGVGVVALAAVVLRERLGCSDAATLAAVAPLALAPSFSVWSTSGLETMAVTLALLASAEGLAYGRWRGAAAGAALVLLRVDGAIWLALVAAAVVASGLRRPRELVVPLALGLAPFLVLLGLRVTWFGELVPNVARVKGSTGPWVWERGLRYVAMTTASCLSPLVLAAGLLPGWRRGGFGRTAALLALAGPAWAVLIGGDFMPFGRILVPTLPFLAITFGLALDGLAKAGAGPDRLLALGLSTAALGLLPALGIYPVPSSVREALDVRGSEEKFLSEHEKWDNMDDHTRTWLALGEALRTVSRPGDALVAGGIGAVGYASDLVVHDRFGLVDPEVAARPLPEGRLTESPGHDKGVPASFFADRRPRFLHARFVAGRLAAGRMKDSLDEWAVPEELQQDYVPQIVELERERDGDRAFLLLVRLREDGEDAAAMWDEHPEERRALNASLRGFDDPS